MQEIKGEECADGGETNALKADNRAMQPNFTDHTPKRGALGLWMRGNARDAPNSYQPQAGQQGANRHRPGETDPIQQNQTHRPADSKRAINGGTNPGQQDRKSVV